jgi:hypothetical protein
MIKQQGGIFGRNPVFNSIEATDATFLGMTISSSDENIIKFYTDNGSKLVGAIGFQDDDLWIGEGGVGLHFQNTGSDRIDPFDVAGNAVNDNAIDLGGSSSRFDDVYATNGTIQTSDANEKQQIASLTTAEMDAAKAISQLFKTFKWNDSVADKGDAARTHTGVIAQEVEQAMTDAGLDAGNYAFFISATWWEHSGVNYPTLADAPEGSTERNRKGIRYPQLLSFVSAATEQRLAFIETRLDALEA